MFSVSQDFAPPFKLILPYFVVGSIFYVISMVLFFFLSVDGLALQDNALLAFTHIYLLGFVMMIIFGAMAQLVPVVLEVGHFAVELFYAIWPLLLVGSLLMAFGFWLYPTLLPFGGTVVLVSFSIFIFEIFLTLKKVKELSLVMSSVLISNIFLLFGIAFGIVMALAYAGMIELDISRFLKAHVFSVVGGYIFITLMGLSVVLLPMFGLSHGFSQKPLKLSMSLMSISVSLVVLNSFVSFTPLEYVAYGVGFTSLIVYFNLVKTIFKTRARKEIDIYAKSLIFAYVSMLIALAFGLIYLFSSYEPLVLAMSFLLFFSLFGFTITGHMYKIVPFLVWFDRFSPLVGKQKVPMLADMLPKKSSEAQLVFGVVGVVVITMAILLGSDALLMAGASFLVVSSIAFLRSVIYMINFKGV